MERAANKRRVIWFSGGVVILAVAVAVGVWLRPGTPDLPTIGLTQIVSHPSLDQVREGIIQGLAKRGYEDGRTVSIVFRNANGDPSLTLPIAQDFVRAKVDVIVPIATPSALGAAKSTTSIPIVFAGVTDPVGVGLVASLDHPGGNVTGTSDRWPFEAQFRFFKGVFPNVKTIGMLYRPGDDVSKVALDAVAAIAPKLGLTVDTMPVSDPGQLYPSAVSLLRRVDAVYTGLDNLVVENLEALLRASSETGKPVLAGDIGSVERGAAAAVSISMLDLGELASQMVVEVLKGGDPAAMPVRVLSTGDPVVSQAAVERFRLDTAVLQKLHARTLPALGGTP